MMRFNIVTKKEYEGSDGTIKKQWKNIGTLVKFEENGDKPESFILELSMFPDTKFFVFEQEKREKKEPVVDQATGKVYPQEVNPDEIPF